MGDSILMHVNDSFCNFLDFSSCIIVLEFFVLFQYWVESSFFHVIKNEINILSVVKKSVKGKNMLIQHESLKF